MFSFCIKHVKKLIIIRQSAENKFRNYLNKNNYSYLAALGPLSLKNTPRSLGIVGYYSSNFNFSQRLESGNFIYPYLVGLYEGDG